MGKDQDRSTDSCEGFLSNNDNLITSDMLRQMLGFAVKYVLPQRDWNYSGDINIRPFKDVSFEERPAVKGMVDSFNSRNAQQMFQKTPLNECLKWLVGYKKGLTNPRCKITTRKRRLTRVAREFKKRLKQKNLYDKKAGQGVVLFVYSVKRQFLGRGRYDNGD